MAVKLPVRSVTVRAQDARPEPARPAAYGRRYTGKEMDVRAKLFAVCILAFAGPGGEAAAAAGRICLAPVAHGASTLDRETGNQRGYVSYSFAVRLDRGEWVPIPSDSPRSIGGFDLEAKHLLAIRDGARQVESFWFTFTGRGGPSLCLSYKPWYQTWLLEPPMNRPWCRCSE